MADNNFRSFRNRDPIAREDADPAPYDAAQDPLAELARLIGQRDRGGESEHSAPYEGAVATLDEAPADGSQDWAADERYAEADPPEQHYAEDSYVQPRLADPYPAERGYARDDQRAPAAAARYAEPAEQYDDEAAYDPRYRDDDVRDDERDDTQYGDDPHDAQRSYAPRDTAPRSSGRQFPPLAPQSHDEQYEADAGDDTDYAYDDDSESTPRRRGVVIILAMLGLVLVGAASAYGYRSMFGGAILVPSLPPIIKPAGGPIKVVPNPASGAQNQSGAVNPGGPEKLVSREEQPVPVQPPPAPPQVISTIPVPQAPSATPGAAPAPAGPNVLGPAPALLPKVAAPAQAPGAASSMSSEPKKIHTVPIRGDQQGNGDTASAAPMAIAPAAAPTAAPAARPRSTEPVARTAPAPRGGANAPLSLVPGAQGAAAPVEPPRTHVARGEPAGAPMATAPAAAPASAPSAGGGYAVQVSSQRSEAEAHSAFKELQAKYPGQLGNRQAMIHRADLGAKGTYYRAMVGPFGSAEQAASLCSSIKAAGGSCIVQRN
jgi:SPOR domain